MWEFVCVYVGVVEDVVDDVGDGGGGAAREREGVYVFERRG